MILRKEKTMNRRIIFGILLTLVVLAGALAVGYYAYQAGVAQGLADSGKLVVPEAGARLYPFYGPFWHRPFGFGFGFLGCLFPVLFFFLFFGLLRGLFWRPWGGGWGHRGHWGRGAPPMFDEWHRQAHGESTSQEPKSQA
jgi:hypothetical protein